MCIFPIFEQGMVFTDQLKMIRFDLNNSPSHWLCWLLPSIGTWERGSLGCYWAIYVCLALGSTQTLTEIVCWCRLFLKLCVSDLLGRLRATQCWFECLVACLDAGGLSKYEYVVCLCVWSLNKGWTSSHFNSTLSLFVFPSFFLVDMGKRLLTLYLVIYQLQ